MTGALLSTRNWWHFGCETCCKDVRHIDSESDDAGKCAGPFDLDRHRCRHLCSRRRFERLASGDHWQTRHRAVPEGYRDVLRGRAPHEHFAVATVLLE